MIASLLELLIVGRKETNLAYEYNNRLPVVAPYLVQLSIATDTD